MSKNNNSTYYVLISFLLVFVWLSPADALQQATVKNKEQVAQKLAHVLINAYGGLDKVKAWDKHGLKTNCQMESISNISKASNKLDCIILSRKNKLRIEYEFIGQKNIFAYDGMNGWTQVGTWVYPNSKSGVRNTQDSLEHGLNILADLGDTKSKLALEPQKMIQGKPSDGIRVTSPNGKWTIFYADPKSHMILRAEYIGYDDEKGIETKQAQEYFDYHLVSGFPVPFKEIDYSDNQKDAIIVANSIVVDDTIGNDLFTMPAASKVSSLEKDPVVIPFEYIGNEIIINASINGGEQTKFIVDTGASQTIIDKSAMPNNLPGNKTYNVTTAGSTVPLSYLKLDKIQLGDLIIEDIPALVSDLSPFKAAIGQSPGGMIGANILRRFLVTIDYAQHQLILDSPDKIVEEKKVTSIPANAIIGDAILMVNGLIDGKQSVNFLIDTGAAINNLPETIAKKLNVAAVSSNRQICGLDGQKYNIGLVAFKNLKLGPFEIANPIFVTQASSNGSSSGSLLSSDAFGILGNPTWNNTKLTIDYKNDRLFIELPDANFKCDNAPLLK